jgi:hypothetical protein
MVPMQNNNDLSSNYAYACFTIMFILVGLITLASCMNLLVLRLATINAEEKVHEKMVADELMKQAVRLDGDVISPRVRQFITQEDITPEQARVDDAISVCSCACMDYNICGIRKFSNVNSNVII